MTCRTSEVAVCRCRDSRNSLSSRVFSMAMTAWAAKFETRAICGERANFLVEDSDRADQLLLLEHRDVENSPNTAELNSGHRRWIALDIHLLCHQVGNMDHLLGPYQAAHDRFGLWPKWHAPAFLDQSGRSVMRGGDAKVVAIAEIQISELGLADPHRIPQHRLEYRGKLAGRARDDTEDLGGRGLLLKRLAQLIEQPRVLNRDDGLRGEIRHQLDLLVGEGPNLGAVDGDGANQIVLS
jgi:hypothetical protein